MKKSTIFTIIILVIVALLAITLSKSNRNNTTIKIGFVGPFSGNSAFFGEFMQKGLDLAMKEYTPEQLANVQIIKEDDVCGGKTAVSAVQKLIDVDHVNYIIGPLCNEASLATEKLFDENKVVSVTIGLPSNVIANMGPYHFSFSPEIEYLMKTLAAEMLKKNLKKVAIIHTVSAFQDENYRHFVKYYVAGGGTIVADEAQNVGTTDFKSSVAKIKEAKPDSLMIIAVTGELNNMIKQINDQGLIKLPKFSIHAAETGLLLQIKDLAEGLIYPYPVDRNQIDSVRAFTEAYKKANNTDPNPYSANTYDSFKILLGAINKCGYANKDCVRTELASLKDYQGANGNLSVDERGVGVYKEIMLKTVKDGKFIVLNENQN